MRHGSLFSGIGGFDLAAEWMGWENVFHCEINEFGRKVLNYHFPKSISHEDITKTDFSVYRGRIDILSGGFPCQPFSSAGNRLGKEDERHLWPQMLRAIKEIAPSWIVGENVYGLINWSNGLVFNEIQTDLEAQGYEVFPFLCPAVSVNAPHVRNRIYFIAHAKFNTKGQNDRTDGKEEGAIRGNEESNVLGTLCGDGYAPDTISIRHRGFTETTGDNKSEFFWGMDTNCGSNGDEIRSEIERCGTPSSDTMQIRLQHCENGGEMGGAQSKVCAAGGESANAIETNGEIQYAADTNNKMLESGDGQGKTGGRADKKVRTEPFDKPGDWSTFPSVPPVCFRDDGFSNRLDGITFPKWRNESIKAAGNAVVPQVILTIFKTIAEYERITTTDKN